jgi:hypothetical protein
VFGRAWLLKNSVRIFFAPVGKTLGSGCLIKMDKKEEIYSFLSLLVLLFLFPLFFYPLLYLLSFLLSFIE